jgi:glycosyltransferase involved in cell wall biosynthesis
LKVVLLSHNLNLEGAPLFAYEYALHLAAQPGWQVRVVSPQDGPLRREFEAAGLPVGLVEAQPLLAARTPADFDRALAALAASLDWAWADLIVANTMVAFWGVHVARRLRKPSLLYIHESAAVRRFFTPLLAPALFRRVEEAFGLASRVVFIAAATQAIHGRLERRGNFRSLPSWIDVARIEQFAASHDRQVLRRRHDLAADAVVIANIGTVCERKGQHVFVRAIDLLQRELAARGRAHPRLQFVMVGARPGAYLDSLRQEITLRGLTNAILIDETPASYDFYHLSDIFVCSSYEESFPRVLMEAAAFRLPIVSTNVNGVTELLGPDDAWLVPPGDAVLLAGAMRAALEAHLAGDRTRAERARRLVADRFNADRTLPLHAALAAEAAASPQT